MAAAAGRVDRRLLRSTRSARAPLAAAVVLGLATAGLLVAQAVLLARIIAGAFVDGDGPGELRGSLAALAAVVVARALVAGGFETSGRLGAGRVMRELRGRLVDHLLRARPTGHDARRTGDLVATAVQGVDALEVYFARYLPQVVLAALAPVFILAFVLPRDLAAGLILLGTLPVLVVFLVLVGLAARTRTRTRWRTLSTLSAHFLDVVRGLETLRANDRVAAQERTLAAAGDAYRRETIATLRVAFLSALVLELFAMLGTALVAATVGLQLADGHLALSTGLAVLILAPELYQPVRQLGAQFHAGADAAAAAEELFAVLDAPPAVRAPPRPAAAPDPRDAAVCLEDVAFTYPARPGAVLDGVTLRLAPGELVALAGASGAGKSTLCALVLRLLDPDRGRVTCGGVDLRTVDPAAWRRRLAWVPQRPTIFSATLGENVALGVPGAPEALVAAALADAGLDDLLAALPAGLDTRIGEGGRPLSAGEAQRVALARAFLRDAPLLVLDEPAAHLDAATATAVGEAIARLARGRTTLLVVHRREPARGADRLVTLAEGRVR